ncbi:hypothetical protein ACWC0C_29530 [Streptomyces sp. NPDC001709]
MAIRDTLTAPGTLALPDPEEADYAFSRRLAIFTAATSAHLNGDSGFAAEAEVSAAAPAPRRPA